MEEGRPVLLVIAKEGMYVVHAVVGIKGRSLRVVLGSLHVWCLMPRSPPLHLSLR